MPGATSDFRRKTRPSPKCSSRSATPPASSARTILATGMSILPTVHGFDEFFGNLYHLNAEEEPELPDYPKDPEFKEAFRPSRRAALRGYRWTTRRSASVGT